MLNYQNGKIYMIESLINNCKYYGSTVDTLSRRLAQHRSSIKSGKTPSSKNVLKYDDARILLIELFPCNNRMELEAQEATYIRNNDCVNKCIPQRTYREYYEDNKEQIKEYQQNNKETISKRMKKYNQDNKEHILIHKKQYQQDNKETISKRKKERYQENKEVIKEKSKKYNQDNKEKIKEKMAKKCLCECGKEYRHSSYKRHTRSQQHKFYQNTYDFIIS